MGQPSTLLTQSMRARYFLVPALAILGFAAAPIQAHAQRIYRNDCCRVREDAFERAERARERAEDRASRARERALDREDRVRDRVDLQRRLDREFRQQERAFRTRERSEANRAARQRRYRVRW